MNTLRKLSFHKNGRPRGWLRAVLFDRRGVVRPALRRIVFKKNGDLRPRYTVLFASKNSTGSQHVHASSQHVHDWLETRWPALQPLTVFPDTSTPRRITVVTDSISPSSLFGEVGTVLILAALWAQRTGAILRIVTRTERPITTSFSAVLKANGLNFEGQVEFLYAPHFGSTEITISPRDLFMATSWWTAQCLLNTLPADRIVYLLQEDERIHYHYGDDHLACTTTLGEPFARIVVNSDLLYKHLTEGFDPVPGLAGRAISFEPAFTYSQSPLATALDTKRKLFFYTSPLHHARNLYATGVRIINEAVLHGVLDPSAWEVHLVGNNIDPLIFNCEMKTVYHKPMAWHDYIMFLQKMDAGLSLMYAPHPSYPPLGLATIGVPVLTNSFGVKTDLRMYSDNIVTAEPTVPAMLDGFRRLIALAEDPATCAANLDNDQINRNWEAALEEVVTNLAQLTEERS
ncbi:MAG: hypothetical protein OSA51_10210 [Octadecabacter sp.]|nr:hypothetical protein [Octadecabacter sp.]